MSDTERHENQCLKLYEHEIHHRGQIYTYLELPEIPVPPLYGLTSEQIRDRSK